MAGPKELFIGYLPQRPGSQAQRETLGVGRRQSRALVTGLVHCSAVTTVNKKNIIETLYPSTIINAKNFMCVYLLLLPAEKAIRIWM